MYRLMTVPDHMLRGENNNRALVGRDNFLGTPYIGIPYLNNCFGCGEGRNCCHACFHPDVPECSSSICNTGCCGCIVMDDGVKSNPDLGVKTQTSAPGQPQSIINGQGAGTASDIVPANPTPKA